MTPLREEYFALLLRDGVVPDGEYARVRAEIATMNAADLSPSDIR